MKALPDSEPLKLCFSIEELPLSSYIECAVTGKYDCLVISGTPTPEQLFEAWIRLQSDFYDAIEDKKVAKNNSLSAKVNRIRLKINVVTCLIVALREKYCEELAEELRAWGYKIGPETAEKDLQKAELSLGNDKTKYALAIKDYENVKSGGGTVTKKHFVQLLMAIGKNRGQHYRPEQITTYEFALMYMELQEYSQQLKSKQDGIQRKDR